MVDGKRQESAAAADLTQQTGLGQNRLSDVIFVTKRHGSAHSELRAMLQQQLCDRREPPGVLVAWISAQRSQIERRIAIGILLANIRAFFQKPSNQLII